MNGSVANFNKFFFSNSCQWVTFAKFGFLIEREQSKVVRAIFVSFLYATHLFIFVNNSKLAHRRQPYPNSMAVFTARLWSCGPSAARPLRQYRRVLLLHIFLTFFHVYCTENLTSLPSRNFSDEFLSTKCSAMSRLFQVTAGVDRKKWPLFCVVRLYGIAVVWRRNLILNCFIF